MRVYYLDVPLTLGEVQELEEMTGWQVEQIRVPFLLPDGRGSNLDQDVPVAPLKAAGILKDYGARSALIQLSSDTVYWTSQFVEAIGRLTGRWPFLIQTERSRESIDSPGELRVLDMDGAMRDI